MMKYMLDTNIIAYIRNDRPEHVRKMFRKYKPEDLCISAITLAELEYGICNSSVPAQNRTALMMLLSGIEVVPFDANAAREYGSIRSALKKRGSLIGANDMLIAAHAKALNVTLVTNNLREFERIDGLKTENWA